MLTVAAREVSRSYRNSQPQYRHECEDLPYPPSCSLMPIFLIQSSEAPSSNALPSKRDVKSKEKVASSEDVDSGSEDKTELIDKRTAYEAQQPDTTSPASGSTQVKIKYTNKIGRGPCTDDTYFGFDEGLNPSGLDLERVCPCCLLGHKCEKPNG